MARIRTELKIPSLVDPVLPIDALALGGGMVPPADGGLAVSDYLEHGLELPSVAERWREVCYAAGLATAAIAAAGEAGARKGT